MRYFYVIGLLSVLCYGCSQEKTKSSITISEHQSEAKRHVDMSLSDLKDLLDSLDNPTALEKKLFQLDFHKRLNDIYISSEMITPKKPKHWITFARMGIYSSVNFKTADERIWINIIKKLKTITRPEKFTDGTSDLAEMYKLKNYKVETYEPRNGINLNLNNLFEVIIMKQETKN